MGAEGEADASQSTADAKLVERLAQSGQERLSRLSSDLIANPVVSAALSRAMAAKARADAVGVLALGQLNLPTADEVSAVRTRLRTVATRAERMEGVLKEVLERLERIEGKLDAHVSGETPGQPTRAPRTPPSPEG
jgi:hypothetical protein